MLYQVDTKYACFGIVVIGGIVTEVAPIGKWMLGKPFNFIKNWCRKKEFKIIEV